MHLQRESILRISTAENLPGTTQEAQVKALTHWNQKGLPDYD